MPKSVWESPPTLLSVDKATEGRRLSPDFFITRLPVELITEVVRHIESSDLANFALTNKDCRQFARWRQFAVVKFSFDPTGLDIIWILHNERLDRQKNHGVSSRPCIGPCIRRALIVPPDSTFLKANLSAGRFYHSKLRRILSTPSVIPHLDAVYWDTPPTGSTLGVGLGIGSMNQMSLHHLALYGPFSDLKRSTIPECKWKLKSLLLEYSDYGNHEDTESEPVEGNLFSHTSPTLVSMTVDCGRLGRLVAAMGCKPSFPALRDFKVIDLDPAEFPALASVLSSSRNLRHFEANSNESDWMGSDGEISEHFDLCGNLPNLETLIWRPSWKGTQQPVPAVSFLRANPQIQTLSILVSVQSLWLENKLLPVLPHCLVYLKSLYLSWCAPSISTPALDHISALTNLEQLCLVAEDEFHSATWGWNCDYKLLFDRLRPLQKLRLLALVRDSGDQGVLLPYPYDGAVVSSKSLRTWRQKHNRFIKEQLEINAKGFPKLEQAFIGQLDMRITREGDTVLVTKMGERHVNQMDEIWLHELFGKWHIVDHDDIMGCYYPDLGTYEYSVPLP